LTFRNLYVIITYKQKTKQIQRKNEERKMEKKTRAELFNEVVMALKISGEDTLAEFVEKELKNLQARAEKETPAQKENRVLREKLVANVLSAKPISIKDIQGHADFSGFSNQKISALLKVLVDEKRVARVEDKSGVLFSLA
jgi:cytoskeletal protein RodZ